MEGAGFGAHGLEQSGSGAGYNPSREGATLADGCYPSYAHRQSPRSSMPSKARQRAGSACSYRKSAP